MIVILKHQTTPLSIKKIQIISEYEIGKIISDKLPPLTVIVSHIDKIKSVQSWNRTPT